MKSLSKKKKKELRTLLARSDNEIDLTDIPEIVNWSGCRESLSTEMRMAAHRTTGCAGEAAQAVERLDALCLCHA